MDVWEEADLTLKRKRKALCKLEDPLAQLREQVSEAKAKKARYKKDTKEERHRLYYEHKNLDVLSDLCDPNSDQEQHTILDVEEYRPLISWLQNPEGSPWAEMVTDLYQRYQPIQSGPLRHYVFISKSNHPNAYRFGPHTRMVLDVSSGRH